MANVLSTYAINPAQAKKQIKHLLERDLVPFIKGQPGAGKSDIIKQIADELKAEVIDIRLSGYEPSDFSLPFREGDRAGFLPTNLFPLEGDELPKGKKLWIVLLDEFNHAHASMIRAAYKIILDRMVGQAKLHPKVKVILAGNRSSDNALTNQVGTALNSRVIHLNLGVDQKQWMEDYAIPNRLDSRVIGYLNAYPEHLNDFNGQSEDQEEHSFCSPRTWDFMSRIISGYDSLEGLEASIVGTITAGVAYSFLQFCKLYETLITVDAVIKDPKGCKVPDDSATRWAVSTMLVQNVTEENIKPIITYIERFPVDNRVIFMKTVMQDPAITKTKVWSEALHSLGALVQR